jgi:hypothetical protein
MDYTFEDHAIENPLRRRYTNIAPDDSESSEHDRCDLSNDDETSFMARTALVRGD